MLRIHKSLRRYPIDGVCYIIINSTGEFATQQENLQLESLGQNAYSLTPILQAQDTVTIHPIKRVISSLVRWGRIVSSSRSLLICCMNCSTRLLLNFLVVLVTTLTTMRVGLLRHNLYVCAIFRWLIRLIPGWSSNTASSLIINQWWQSKSLLASKQWVNEFMLIVTSLLYTSTC